MNSLSDSPRLSKSFYTKMSATATKQFSEEMQKRRKPFILNETESTNDRFSIKKSNKENTVKPISSSPYNKTNVNKALQFPCKNIINTTVYHNPSKALMEGKSKYSVFFSETVPISNSKDLTSIELHQAPMPNKQNNTSDVEEMLQMRTEMTGLKQKLEEEYKTTLRRRDQLISYGSTTHERPEMTNIDEISEISTNLSGTSELLTATALLTLAKASGIATQSQQPLSQINAEPCNLKRETLNESPKYFTSLLNAKETNGNETSELKTFAEVTSKESLITAETYNGKKETLIKRVNLLRHVMVLTSRATGGNETSGYHSLSEEDFNNYKTENLINSTPLTDTATKEIEENNEAVPNTSLFATSETVGNEIYDKINSIAVKELAETSGNETGIGHNLLILNEMLKNLETLADHLKLLTDTLASRSEETKGIEINSSTNLGLVAKEETELNIESINQCLKKLVNEYLTRTETKRIETNTNKETNENETNQSLCPIAKEENNIGEEENLNMGLNSIETKENNCEALRITIRVKETSGIETPRYLTQLIPELNKGLLPSKATNGNETNLRKSTLKANLPYICNKIKTIGQIPKEIIKIPKKYLNYRTQNREKSDINKGNEIETKTPQGNEGNGELETKIAKKYRVEVKIPIRSLHSLNNVEEQRERYEMEQLRQVERKNKAITWAFPDLREDEINKKEFCWQLPKPDKQSDMEKYGGMLYGLWNAVKKYPSEAHANVTRNGGSKNERETGEQRRQLDNRGENRQMEEDIFNKKAGEKQNKEESRNVQQPEMIARRESHKEKIPKKKVSFRRSFRSCFAREEKTNAIDAKNRGEANATGENDSEGHSEIERLTEHYSQIFHI